MNTRSESNKIIRQFEVNIDFDGASEAGKNNKKSIGNSSYKYICIAEKNGIKCGKSCYKALSYCWQHRKYNEKLLKESLNRK
jgi:hypothetical protein